MIPATPPSELPLRDVHLPDPISWWPLAFGWWITLAVIPILLWITFFIYKYLTRKTAVKAAKKILAELKRDETKNDRQKVQEISVLIRRVAISLAPRENCAGLTGIVWLEYLDKDLKDKPFTQGIGKCLAEAGYRKSFPENFNIEELMNLTERWLKSQKAR